MNNEWIEEKTIVAYTSDGRATHRVVKVSDVILLLQEQEQRIRAEERERIGKILIEDENKIVQTVGRALVGHNLTPTKEILEDKAKDI